MTQEEIEILNSSILLKDIEFIIKNVSTKKTWGPDGFTGEFHQTVKKKIISVLHSLLKIRGNKTSEYLSTVTAV